MTGTTWIVLKSSLFIGINTNERIVYRYQHVNKGNFSRREVYNSKKTSNESFVCCWKFPTWESEEQKKTAQYLYKKRRRYMCVLLRSNALKSGI
jgi:hypothetical protein